jgi:hypothetical protein
VTIKNELPPPDDSSVRSGSDEKPEYEATAAGIVWNKRTPSGLQPTLLANFTASIVAGVVMDDGVEKSQVLEIETLLDGRHQTVRIPAARFASMRWPIEQLGASAIVEAGHSIIDRTRVAIQHLSGQIPRRIVYSHVGWAKLDSGHWVFLHAGGAIGADAPVGGVEVSLPESLGNFRLPAQLPDAHRGVRAAVEFLKVAPLSITVPLFGSIWRAAVGGADFGLHLVGPTGACKTAVASVAQQFFGKEMTSGKLPGSWSSTDNALEALMFHAADSLFVIDDFVGVGGANDIQRLHGRADRIFRGQANGSARQRMRADATLRPPKPPRCLVVSTGEDSPRGQSLRGRMLILELAPGDVDLKRLTVAQEHASSGLFSQVLAAFIRREASRRDALREERRKLVFELRNKAAKNLSGHPRAPEIVANLAVALWSFLDFAVEADALTPVQAAELRAQWWPALLQAGAAQAQFQTSEEPARRFLELVSSALSSGRAHLADTDGGTPSLNPTAWGWRSSGVEIQPQGDRIGWIDSKTRGVFLDPTASYRAAQSMMTGDAFPVSIGTLKKRLHEKGHLVRIDAPRETLTVRRMAQGRKRDVLHLKPASLSLVEPDQPDQDSSGPSGGRVDGQLDSTDPTTPNSTQAAAETGSGRNGQVGRVSIRGGEGGGQGDAREQIESPFLDHEPDQQPDQEARR